MAKPFQISAWDANGVVARRAELAAFANDFDLDAILHTETFLTPRITFALPAYVTYRQDRQYQTPTRRNSGGTAILIHRRNAHREFTPPATRLLETTRLLAACLKGGGEIRLISVYRPPGAARHLL